MAVLVLAVAVLVIGAIGTSVTGNGIFDWMKKSTDQSSRSSGGGNCIQPEYSNCIEDCGGEIPPNRESCMRRCDEVYCNHEGWGDQYRGMLGQKYLEAGMSSEDLRNYRAKYDEEGNLMYEMKMVDGSLGIHAGEGYSIEEGLKGELNLIDYGGGDPFLLPVYCTDCGPLGTCGLDSRQGDDGMWYTVCDGTCSICTMKEYRPPER